MFCLPAIYHLWMYATSKVVPKTYSDQWRQHLQLLVCVLKFMPLALMHRCIFLYKTQKKYKFYLSSFSYWLLLGLCYNVLAT